MLSFVSKSSAAGLIRASAEQFTWRPQQAARRPLVRRHNNGSAGSSSRSNDNDARNSYRPGARAVSLEANLWPGRRRLARVAIYSARPEASHEPKRVAASERDEATPSRQRTENGGRRTNCWRRKQILVSAGFAASSSASAALAAVLGAKFNDKTSAGSINLAGSSGGAAADEAIPGAGRSINEPDSNKSPLACLPSLRCCCSIVESGVRRFWRN